MWKDLLVYRIRRRRLTSFVELVLPVLLSTVAWVLLARFPDSHRVRMDALPAGSRADACDGNEPVSRLAFAPVGSTYTRELVVRAFPALAAARGE